MKLLLTASLWSLAVAFLPPEDWEEWEPVHVYRQNQGIEYSYQPKHINPELCRFLTEEECEREDSLAVTSTTGRRLQTRSAPYQGEIRVLMPLIQFPEHNDRTLPPKSYFEEMCNGSKSDINPVGSIREFFEQQSNGVYKITCEVIDWKMADNSMAFYAQGQSGLLGSDKAQLFMHSVLTEIDNEKTAQDMFWKGPFDTEGEFGYGDGWFDAVVAVHSGFRAESGVDCKGVQPKDRFWSQAYPASGPGAWEDSLGGTGLGPFVIASAFDGPCDDVPARMGIMVHEWIHMFTIPDLYDPTNNKQAGVGAYDIMASPYGQGRNLAIPGSLSPWTKMKLGWLKPVEITTDGEYSLPPSTWSITSAYIIREKFGPDEYLLLENRRKQGFDSNLWSSGGMVMYHVDESYEADFLQSRPGFPGQAGWPQNGNHYTVAVLQADGEYELERSLNRGDELDLWTPGMALTPDGTGDKAFPNSDSYEGGTIQTTGITIRVLSDGNGIMTFSVEGLGGSNGGGSSGFGNTDSSGSSGSTGGSTGSESNGGSTGSETNGGSSGNTESSGTGETGSTEGNGIVGGGNGSSATNIATISSLAVLSVALLM